MLLIDNIVLCICRLEGMFKDIDLSHDIMNQYAEYDRSRGDSHSIGPEFHVQVLTVGFWPTYPAMNSIIYPPALAAQMVRFISCLTPLLPSYMYIHMMCRHGSRNIMWPSTVAVVWCGSITWVGLSYEPVSRRVRRSCISAYTRRWCCCCSRPMILWPTETFDDWLVRFIDEGGWNTGDKLSWRDWCTVYLEFC